MSSARTLAVNLIVQSAGKILSVLLGLAMLAILTRALSPDGFGQYTTALTFLQFFGVIVDFGLTLTLLALLSEPGADEAKVAGNILGLRLFSAAILFALAPLAALPFAWSPAVKLGIAVGAVAYFFMAGATMLVGVFQKHAAMWRSALAEIGSRLLLVALVALFAIWHLGVVPMIGALIAANLLWLILTLWLARPLVSIRPRADLRVWKKTLSRSWPIAISIIFNLLYLRGDIFILSLFRSSAEVGYYGVAYKLLDVLTALPVMFMGLILPALVADWAAGRLVEFQRHLARIFDLFMILVLPIVFGTLILARPLIILLAGPEFAPAAPVLQILALALLGIFFGALYGHTVVAINRQRQMIWGYIVTALLSLIGYFFFIPRYGMPAAAAVTVFSELFLAFLTFLMVWKTSRALPSLAATNQVLLACGLMSVCLLLLPPLPVLILVGLGALIYLLALFFLGGIKKEDLRLLLPHNPSS